MVDHIFIKCVFAREVWHCCFTALDLNIFSPDHNLTLIYWWDIAKTGVPEANKRSFDTFFIATIWSLWTPRNTRVLGDQPSTEARGSWRIKCWMKSKNGASPVLVDCNVLQESSFFFFVGVGVVADPSVVRIAWLLLVNVLLSSIKI